jgi:indole-3-glycerol phosphate synthase
MILDRIVEAKRNEIAGMKAGRGALEKELASPELTVIAEIKRASPSRGVIEKGLEPAERLEAYVRGGARAVSVVTDGPFFHGKAETLRELRAKTDLPILRKDFIIDPIQLYESRFLGADAVLLIASVLKKEGLLEMLGIAESIGLEALVEVHGEEELRMVLDTPARLVGINNRDLSDFSVDLGVTERLMGLLRDLEPQSRRRIVAESGVDSPEDALFLAQCGVDGILVGSYLVETMEPEGRIKEILERVTLHGAC